jgi:hypothetical protein
VDLAARAARPVEGAACPTGVPISQLGEDLERLVLLEQVGASRQQGDREAPDQAVDARITPEQPLNELGLPEISGSKLPALNAPDLAERLGISQETVEKLKPTRIA